MCFVYDSKTQEKIAKLVGLKKYERLHFLAMTHRQSARTARQMLPCGVSGLSKCSLHAIASFSPSST